MSPDDEPFEFEALWYVAARAYEAVTGEDDYHTKVAPAIARSLRGILPEEEDIAARHPRLAKRFGMG